MINIKAPLALSTDVFLIHL